MTPDELRMLTDLANKVAQTPAPPRDAEAEAFIRSHIGARPDALYLMTQTVLIQNMALQQAQEQIRTLQQQQQRTPQAGISGGSGSFLGGGLGQPVTPQQPQYAQPQQQYAPPQSFAPTPQPAQGGAPSFLKGAATTAAGVAAGALAFEGIRSLFSHPGYGMGNEFGGFGSNAGLMGGRGPTEETIVNNYYDSPGPEGHAGNHLVDDVDDSNADDSQTQDADYDDTSVNDDTTSSDDSSDVA